MRGQYDGKPCKRCGSTLRYAANRSCVQCSREAEHYKKYRKRYYQANKEAVAEHGLLRRFGITLDDKKAMYARQGGKCAICTDEIELMPSAVDHCHTTGKVRGLLCLCCNFTLGLMKDDTTRLRNAITYLETA